MRCRDDTKRRVAYRDLRPLVLDPVIAARVEGAGRLALRHHDDMACCTLCDLEVNNNWMRQRSNPHT